MGMKPLAEFMPLQNWDSSVINREDQPIKALVKLPFFLALAATYSPNAIKYPLYNDMQIGKQSQEFRANAV